MTETNFIKYLKALNIYQNVTAHVIDNNLRDSFTQQAVDGVYRNVELAWNRLSIEEKNKIPKTPKILVSDAGIRSDNKGDWIM